MKIALVILNARPERGGAERYTVELGTSLAARGHDISLLATRFARDVGPVTQVHLAGAAGSRIGRFRQFSGALAEHLRQVRYDVVHAMLPIPGCTLYHPHAGIEAYNLEQGHLRHNSPIRQTISQLTNQLNRKRRLYARAERQVLERDRAAVLCLSRAMEQIAEQYYDLDDSQGYVLTNGVDLGRYDPAGQQATRQSLRQRFGFDDSNVVALLMANNYRLKGLKQAMQALAAMDPAAGQRARLLVVGREPVESYRRLAERLGVGERVIFAGSTDEPETFYAASDLFLLPTAYDSCSLVVLEALAMGKPVITTRQNGAAEVMSDGVHGFVIDAQGDLEGLRESWNALLNDSLRAKIADAAMQLRPSLSKERHVERLLEIYSKIIRPSASVQEVV